MPELPQRLSEPILIHCKRLQVEFEVGGTYDALARKIIPAVVEAGAQENDVTALLVGLAASEAWLEDRQRAWMLETNQFARENLRPEKQNHYGGQAFRDRANTAYAMSERGIRQAQTLLMYAFSLRCGKTNMSAPLWRPMVPLIVKLVSSLDIDDAEATLEAIRQRIRRWKKNNARLGGNVLPESYFSEVYATLFGQESRP